MHNIVFKSISCSNYGSFSNSVKLDMTTTTTQSQIIDGHTFIAGDNMRFNKLAYIFGANGSGKSTLCKVILQIQNKLLLSPIMSSNNPQLMEIKSFKDDISASRNHFKFNKKNEFKETDFGIELLIDDILYSYCFSISNENLILKEKLSKKKKRTEIILNRTSPNYESIELKSELKTFKNNIAVVKENSLCLSMASFLNNDIARLIVDAINNIKVKNMTGMQFSYVSEKSFTKELKQKYLNLLVSASSTLKDISVEFDEEKVERKSFGTIDFENRELVLKKIKINVESTHNVYENGLIVDTINLPFFDFESIGTIKLFNLLPLIFDTLENGGVLVVDEIENGLHPYMVNMIVSLFNEEKNNPLNAQLICTTHSTMLIDKNVQKDEIWLAIKNEFGESELKHIGENVGLKSSDKLGKKMLMNAFGGMPKIFVD